MKILVLGAGAIGGYFGGRLVQAGGDIRFLVREGRRAQLAERGLVVQSPHGDFSVPVNALTRDQLGEPADLVLLACKAYDLEAAIQAIGPAVGAHTVVLPLLNGIAHIERLAAAFGSNRVAGGSCGIPATLTPEGEVVQLGPLHRIVFGALPGTATQSREQLEELRRLLQKTPVEVQLVDNMMLALWEKFVGLATMAAMTCLMRGAITDILATEDGAGLMEETYMACESVARAAGYVPRDGAMAAFRTMFADRQSVLTASMLRDLEGGGRTEGAHVVGDMVARARAAGIDPGPLRAAWCHLQAAEHRRLREAR
ncbi:MAG: ketopantoate reductase family protein [Rubrivivax sp.]|nr:ketopantoate reductase family protein [Rubrivivax sp.]MDP3615740.1 ketopantoate reductase family protein [Rubrivivax sp.]